MTYVILHGELNNIQGKMSDGALTTFFLKQDPNNSNNEKWDYKKDLLQNASDVFELGNYYPEEESVEGWSNEEEWDDSRRNFVYFKWKELIDIIEKNLKETGRIDIDLLNFFTPEKERISVIEDCKYRLRTVIENITRGTIKAEDIIEIMDAVENAGY